MSNLIRVCDTGLTALRRVAVLVGLALGVGSPVLAQSPLGSALTYQGELSQTGSPATGTFDLRFRLFDAASGGSQVGPTLCVNDLAVTAGRFTVSLDFGSVFAGETRWIELDVRADVGGDCADGTGFETLTPRQTLSAAPNATFATNAAAATTATTAASATTASNALTLNGQSPSFYQNAGNLTGTLTLGLFPPAIARLDTNQTFTGVLNLSNGGNSFAGSFSGSGAGLTNLNASNLATGTVPAARLNLTGVDGAGLLNLNGANLTNGSVTRAKLSTEVQSVLGTLTPDWSTTPYQVLSSTATGTTPFSMVLSGRYAYVTNSSANTLQTFDLINPAAPVLVSSVATGNQPIGMAVSGGFAYVNNRGAAALQVFSLSNPAVPALVGTVATGSTPNTVVVSGNFAYVSCGSGSLQIFSLANPAAPTLTGSIATGAGANSLGLVVSGSFAYVGINAANQILAINVSNPAAPVLAATVPTIPAPINMVVSGSFMYVSFDTGGNVVQVYNISNPASPTLANSVATGANPYALAASGNYLYVGNSSGGTFQVFDTSAAPSLTPIGTLAVGSGPRAVAVAASGYAYLLNQSTAQLQVISTAAGNIGYPTGITTVSLPSTVARTNIANAFGNFTNSFAGSVGIGTTNPGANKLQVVGTFTATTKNFTIDHPLDPTNKVLVHSTIESDEYKNFYDGVVVTDDAGFATVTLPDWFEALNENFRYQLTVIDESAPDVHFVRVVSKVGVTAKNTFVIKSIPANMEVSWAVTGTRKDAYVKLHPLRVEQEKSAEQRGTYLHPEAHQPAPAQSDAPKSQGAPVPGAKLSGG